jgi:hypothetical protein
MEAGFNKGGGVSNGHDDVGKPCKGVGNAFGIGRLDVDSIALVGVHGGADIPAFDAVGRPGFLLGGLVMDNFLDARGCYGVQLRPNWPWTCTQAKRFGLMQDPCSRLRVKIAWGRRQHHRWRGN